MNCLNGMNWALMLTIVLMTACADRQTAQTVAPAETTVPPSPTAASPTPSVEASPSVAPSPEAGQVELENGRISFVPPPGFTPMTAEEIATKYPNRTGNPPKYVYANDRRNVSIAITLSDASIQPDQLPELKEAMPKFISQAVPDTEWLVQDFATINGIQWVQLEFISQAIDTKIHNDTYFTSSEGKLVGFNFNATVEQYESAKAALMRSRDSIEVRQ